MAFWEEDHRGKAPFSSHQEYMLSTWLITDDVNLDNLAELMSIRFLHCKPIPHFHIPWKEVTMNSLYFRGREYLQKLFGILLYRRCVYSLPFLYLFPHLTIYLSVWTHLLCSLGYNPIPFYFDAQTVLALVTSPNHFDILTLALNFFVTQDAPGSDACFLL